MEHQIFHIIEVNVCEFSTKKISPEIKIYQDSTFPFFSSYQDDFPICFQLSRFDFPIFFPAFSSSMTLPPFVFPAMGSRRRFPGIPELGQTSDLSRDL